MWGVYQIRGPIKYTYSLHNLWICQNNHEEKISKKILFLFKRQRGIQKKESNRQNDRQIEENINKPFLDRERDRERGGARKKERKK